MSTATTSRSELRALRRQIRVWRRGRADTRLVDAISDAYIAVFATVMLSSMAVNVVVNVRTVATDGCTGTACRDARAALPLLFGIGVVVAALAVARLLGPMLVSPAVATWLLPAPLDRTALLRPRLAASGGVTIAAAGVLAAGAATLAGYPSAQIASFTAVVAGSALLALGLAVVCQARRLAWVRVLTWVLAAAVWAGLVLVTVDAVPSATSTARGRVGWPAAAVVVVLALVAHQRAYASLPLLGRDQLAPGGSLVPGLSGALASLDFALVYDLLLARHWKSRSTVRTVAGRGSEAGALVWRELVRLRRTPQLLVTLAAALVVPYLGSTLGLGRVDLLLASTTAFFAGAGLFSSLRVLSRTPSLLRALPLTPAVVRTACLSVPAVPILVWGLAASPALHTTLTVAWSDAVVLSLAVAATAVVAVVRWVTGRPPDYQLPLVTSPMGAVPTSLFVSAARGFDVLLVGTAPLLIAPTPNGALVSLVLDGAVLLWLTNRK